jgi:CRP-like cAMP-binding protein
MKTKYLFSVGNDTSEFKEGEIIFNQGDPGDSLYSIIEGTVDIIANGKVVSTLEQQSIFGEMSLIDKSPRSATAIAKTDCKINKIDEKRFIFLVQQAPYFAFDILSVLANRIRELNEKIK